MIKEILERLPKEYVLEETPIKGMDGKEKNLTIHSYRLGKIGNLSAVEIRKGLKQIEYLFIVPLFSDAPLLFCHWEESLLHHHCSFAFYDLCLAKGKKYPRLLSLKEKYASLPDAPAEKRSDLMDTSLFKQGKEIKEKREELIEDVLTLYLDLLEDSPVCDVDDKRNLLIPFETEMESSELFLILTQSFGKEQAQKLFSEYILFSKDTSLVSHAEDKKIRKLNEIFLENPDAQLMFVFKGRSVPATYGEAYEQTAADGSKYLAVMCWDGDSGNAFDIDYRLVPEKVFSDGKEIKY